MENMNFENNFSGSTETEPAVSTTAEKQRHGFVTFWLWFVIIFNSLEAIYSLATLAGSSASLSIRLLLPGASSIIINIVNIVATSLMLKWKKTGFYLIIVSAVLGIILNIVNYANFGPLIALASGISAPVYLAASSLLCALSVVIWWAILQIKKNGVSAWKQLE